MTERAIALYGRAVERLKGVAGFAGLGFGLRETGGRLTADRAWRVYVSLKRAPRSLTARQRVPARLFDLPTDVIEVAPTGCAAARPAREPGGPPRALLAEGSAIANDRGVPGSLGCLAWRRRTGQPVLLSSYHVLFAKRCQRGDPIWSVPRDADAPPQPIGRLLSGKVGLAAGCSAETFVDAATGSLDEAAAAHLPVHAAAAAATTTAAEPGAGVSKLGAATGRTTGVVVDTCYPDRWYWEYRSENAPRQVLLRATAPDGAPFSRSGDSGAVVRDDRGRLVGLLWGCNARGEGVACPIEAVALSLGLQFGDPLAEQKS